MRFCRLATIAGLICASLVLHGSPLNNKGAAAQPDTSEPGLPLATQASIDSTAAKVLADTGVPSASISVVRGGRIVYNHAYGQARVDPVSPATTAMRYEIGSVSKQFTAAAMLLLQQEGKLKLEDPVGRFLPDLTRSGEITLRMILSHTSGYQDYWPEDYLMAPMLKPVTTSYILDTWAKKPLDFEPGTRWQYSNTNYVIAAAVIEKVTGQPYMKFIHDRILAPLEMRSAMNVDTGEPQSADALGYYRHALGPLRPAPKEGKGWMFGAFELAMTPADLSLWNISLLHRTLLKPESYAEMFRPIKLADGTDTHYGLGVFSRERDGHLLISHSGETSGFVSENDVYLQDDVAIAVFTNEDAVSAASIIARQVAALILDDDKKPAEGASLPEAEVLKIFVGLQQGRIDRSKLAPNCDAYFSQQALEDFASSLGPLGNPLAIHETGQEERGGMVQRIFRADFRDRHLTINTYVMPDGRYEQFLVTPAE